MEKFDMENFPTSPGAIRMMESVSLDFYEKSYVGKWLYQVMGLEYDAVLDILEELPKQFFPETATWGIRYHEEKWQLPVMETLEIEERRRRIYEKRDFRAPMTPYKMEQYLNHVTGMEFHVLDCHDSGGYVFHPEHPNIFKVIYILEDLPGMDIKRVRKILDRIKQSHTDYILTGLIIIVMDNRSAEHIYVQKLCIHFAIPFQVAWLLDGEYCLNGEKLLDSSIKFGMFTKPDDTRVIHKDISMRHHEQFGSAGVTIKKNAWFLDGENLLDGSRLLNAEVTYETI